MIGWVGVLLWLRCFCCLVLDDWFRVCCGFVLAGVFGWIVILVGVLFVGVLRA